jgi:hypothetical protein
MHCTLGRYHVNGVEHGVLNLQEDAVVSLNGFSG